MASPALAQQKAVMTDPLTGVALSGYDPVAYFTENAPTHGSPLFAAELDGVTWYFASAANRDVFLDAPDVYAPLFGGHCATSLARGYVSDGNPQLFRIVSERLVLFHSIGNRSAFDAAPASQLAAALTRWDNLPNFQAQMADAQ